jgi:hypothetical protein
MGFYIHEEFETKLHFKDVCCIQMAISHHLEEHGEHIDSEMKTRMNKLINRLGREMYDHPDNDKPNAH